MPQVGFETKIPESEREKTVHALDRAATVTGSKKINIYKNPFIVSKNISSSYPGGTSKRGPKFQLSFMLLPLLWEEALSVEISELFK
jgi:hypothetical protein